MPAFLLESEIIRVIRIGDGDSLMSNRIERQVGSYTDLSLIFDSTYK